MLLRIYRNKIRLFNRRDIGRMGIKVLRYGIITLLALLCSMEVSGQNDNIGIPYYCSFEDSAENAKWVINAGADGELCNDKWYISSSTAYDGHNSLYISADGGVSPVYGVKQPNVVVAYRPMVLPPDVYDISFDWKNLATDESGMYVCIITESDDSVSNATSGNVPVWIMQTAQWITPASGSTTQVLRQGQSWQNASFQLPVLVRNRRIKLAFVWVNNCTDSLSNRLSACVDNIQVTSAKCRKPQNFIVESSCDSVHLTWDGVSSSYELEYRMRGSNIWRKVAVQGKEYTFRNMQEGGYDFRVRGICYQDTSAYANNYTAIVFCPEMHCINYVDLTEENGVNCSIGMATGNIFSNQKVDLGPDDMESRHTVHWTQGQYDPRTGNQLLTVPEGEFASVRLGNWKTGGEAERIEYEFTVDSTADILLMKYAIVLEDPSHDEDEQPKFTLEILDEWGDRIDPTCGVADFYADRNRPGWNTYVNAARNAITWKDWTTVGLNLSDYRGQRLTIRLTTRDCTLNGHFGYAYLTLNCTEGEIKGMSCGDDPEMELAAPEGFSYSWTNSSDPSFRSDKRVISVDANDITTYYCRCSFTENKGCYFDLSTVVEPRFPKAEFSYEVIPQRCMNVVKFKNESHVVIRKDGVETAKDEPCEEYVWVFGEGEQSSEINPEYVFPKEGGSFPVTLLGSIAGGNCVDDTTLTVTVKPLNESRDTIWDTVCSGEGYVFCEHYLMSSDTVVCVKSDMNGCDSVTVLCLTVLPPIEDTEIYDTICFGESYDFGNGTYRESGDYENWIENEKGCRGVEVLHLTVRDEITFSCTHTDVIDTPNSGSITISGAPEGYTYSLNGEYGAPLSGLAGGEYTVVVYDTAGCASEPEKVYIEQNCLEFTVDSFAPACADYMYCMAAVEVSSGKMSGYSVRYGDKAQSVGFRDTTMELNSMDVWLIIPDACRPDVYDVEVVFHDEICGDTVMPMSFTVLYPSNIVQQKWNNVLAVKNETYNGGYTFSMFQWYRNNAPITGGVESYIYLGEEAAFDTTDVYSVMLTRADDGVTMPTCPIIPEVHTDVTEFPRPAQTVVSKGGMVRIENVSGSADVRLYNAAGQLYAVCAIDEYSAEVSVPPVPGVYLMAVESGGATRYYKIAVR